MLTHPENGVVLTDRRGQPVNIGQTVIIARKSSRYGGAQLAEATIKRITPLVLHPRYGAPDPSKWYNTGTHSGYPLVREDQLSKSHQTEYLMRVATGQDLDWANCFVATVEVPGMSRLHTVPFGHNLVVA